MKTSRAKRGEGKEKSKSTRECGVGVEEKTEKKLGKKKEMVEDIEEREREREREREWRMGQILFICPV